MKNALFALCIVFAFALAACRNNAGKTADSTQDGTTTQEEQPLQLFDSVAHAKVMEQNRKQAEANAITPENFKEKGYAGAIAVGKVERTAFEKKESIVNAAKSFLGSKSIAVTADNGEYAYNLVDLNGDGIEDVLLYLYGANFCDGSNCTLLVGKGEGGDKYKFHSMIQFLSLPILVCDDSSTKGWKDIVTQVFDAEGAATSIKLAFDGKKYPDYAKLPTAQRLGKAVMASGFLMDASKTGLNLGY